MPGTRFLSPPRRYQQHFDYDMEYDKDDDLTDYTYKRPKQKDKSKSKPNAEQEYSEKTGAPENNSPYSAYQYEFPYQYPYNFFSVASSMPNSSTSNSKTKTKKKSSSSGQNAKKSSKDQDKSVVPFISISVAASHQAKNVDPDSQQNDSSQSHTDANSKSVYSPNNKPTPDQAAYFNYLNTYTPTQNQDPNQHAQVAGVFNSAQYGYGAGNSYEYSPFNGYNPMLMPYYNVATTPSPIGRSEQNPKLHESSRSVNQKTKTSRGNHASSKKNVRKP